MSLFASKTPFVPEKSLKKQQKSLLSLTLGFLLARA